MRRGAFALRPDGLLSEMRRELPDIFARKAEAKARRSLAVAQRDGRASAGRRARSLAMESSARTIIASALSRDRILRRTLNFSRRIAVHVNHGCAARGRRREFESAERAYIQSVNRIHSHSFQCLMTRQKVV